MGKRTAYYGIDGCKLIAAVLIVVLHAIETSHPVAAGVKWVFTRFAVPFFFIASGFFFFKGLDSAEDIKAYFRKYEKRLLKMFLIWAVVISGPITVFSYIRDNTGKSPVHIALLLIRRFFIIGPGPYWYLIALMLSVAFFYVCYTRKWAVVAVLGMVVGFILQILYACFRNTLGSVAVFSDLMRGVYLVFSWEFNFIMYGVPFFGIGYFIAQKDFTISSKKAVAWFAITTLLRGAEYAVPFVFSNVAFWRENCISLAFIPQAVAFFFMALHWQPALPEKLYARQLSTFLYCAHAIVLYDILDPLMVRLCPKHAYAPSAIWIKVILVLLVCWTVFWILKKANKKYLNLLIGG